MGQDPVTQNLLIQRQSLLRNIESVKLKLEQALLRRKGEEEEERKVSSRSLLSL